MKKSDVEKLSYEEAYKRLEDCVEQLESGDLTLEQSLKIFEESVSLVVHCSKKLEEAERRIELLINTASSRIETETTLLEFD